MLVGCAACTSGGDASSDDGGKAAILDAGADAGATDFPVGDPAILVGAFRVRLVAATSSSAGYTSVLGAVADGPTPELVVYDEAAAADGCRLLVPRVPFCAPACAGAVCVEDDTCAPYPVPRAVGAVTLSGLVADGGATSFTMTPVAAIYQPPVDVDLPFPAFTEDDVVTLAAAGSDFTGPFTIAAQGIAPLVLDDAVLAIESGTALVLAWNAPVAAARVRVKLDVSHHGGSKGKIECDVDDTGALAIPAALVDALVALGTAGFPTIVVERARTASAVISAGRVDLVLSSSIERAVTIDGVTSCHDDEDCPASTSCQSDLTCH